MYHFKNLFMLFFAGCLLLAGQGHGYSVSQLYHDKDIEQAKLQGQLEKRLKGILPDDLYMVRLEIVLKVIYDKPQDMVRESVLLGKLGEAEPLGGKYDLKRRIVRQEFSDNVREVKVDLMIDHSIEQHLEAEIRNVVHAILGDYSKSRVQLNLSRILFKKTYAADAVTNFKYSAKENSSVMIGVAVFLAVAFLFWLLVSWIKGGVHSIKGLAHRVLDVMEEKAKHVPGQIIISNSGLPGAVAVPPQSAESGKKEELRAEINLLKGDLSHLIAVAAGRPMLLTHLVREWIFKNNPDSNATLTVLPEILGTDLFATVVVGLSEEERELWSLNMVREICLEDLNKARTFMRAHSHELLVDVNAEKENLAISTDECVEIIYKDLSVGSQLLKNLPEGQVKLIFQRLPKAYVGKVIESGLQGESFRPQEFLARVKLMVTALREDKFKGIPPSYVEYIVQQLKDVGPKREKDILQMFRRNGRMEVLHNVARQVIPSEIIFQMPMSFLKAVLLDFNIVQRAEFVILAQSEQKQQLLLGLGEKGSCERAAVDVEMERMENDPKVLKTIKENADVIWREFNKQARNSIKASPELEQQAFFLLDRWIFNNVTFAEKNLKKVA